MFHPRIKSVLHARISRVCQNGSISQCARTNFSATLKPADDFSRRQITRDPVNEFLLG